MGRILRTGLLPLLSRLHLPAGWSARGPVGWPEHPGERWTANVSKARQRLRGLHFVAPDGTLHRSALWHAKQRLLEPPPPALEPPLPPLPPQRGSAAEAAPAPSGHLPPSGNATHGAGDAGCPAATARGTGREGSAPEPAEGEEGEEGDEGRPLGGLPAPCRIVRLDPTNLEAPGAAPCGLMEYMGFTRPDTWHPPPKSGPWTAAVNPSTPTVPADCATFRAGGHACGPVTCAAACACCACA